MTGPRRPQATTPSRPSDSPDTTDNPYNPYNPYNPTIAFHSLVSSGRSSGGDVPGGRQSGAQRVVGEDQRVLGQRRAVLVLG